MSRLQQSTHPGQAHTLTDGTKFVLGAEELKSAERILKELFPESLQVKLRFQDREVSSLFNILLYVEIVDQSVKKSVLHHTDIVPKMLSRFI